MMVQYISNKAILNRFTNINISYLGLFSQKLNFTQEDFKNKIKKSQSIYCMVFKCKQRFHTTVTFMD